MACIPCERTRQIAKRVREKAEAIRLRFKRLRNGENPDAPSSDPATTDSEGTAQAGTSTRAKPAGKAKPAHGERSMAKASRGGAGS